MYIRSPCVRPRPHPNNHAINSPQTQTQLRIFHHRGFDHGICRTSLKHNSCLPSHCISANLAAAEQGSQMKLSKTHRQRFCPCFASRCSPIASAQACDRTPLQHTARLSKQLCFCSIHTSLLRHMESRIAWRSSKPPPYALRSRQPPAPSARLQRSLDPRPASTWRPCPSRRGQRPRHRQGPPC